ncbi:MAG: divalent metal cation transporter MntH [Bryobacteraceae bacterium]|nr:MAG: divalent metal cation transporter MntH [Bryobacteraceae bacterium]
MGSSAPSLPEVHSSVPTSYPSLWKRMFAFAGPAYLVSVGYMDPGNWATDIEGGSRFGYRLLWVLVVSNLMAILLQTLSARLGIVTGRDLAQACREAYPRPVSWALWVLAEIAIAACDLAELLGAAIGLNLLFGLPLILGVALTALDTLLILWFGRLGIRLLESIILGFITVIAGCFVIEIFLARPAWAEVAAGLLPRLDAGSLYVAVAMLGATVMPHNLYLHSSLVQTRAFAADTRSKRLACRFNLVDSAIALNGALLVNAAILILAASTFYRHGIVVTEIQQAHRMLEPLLGTTLAGAAFALALLFSGQSSTITGTMAGQIVMEGFLNFRMRPWLRRLITRAVAVVPAALTIHFAGDAGAFRLLILSQVVLSLQLPFAIVPLIRFTSDRRRMGELVSAGWVRALGGACAVLIVGLNLWLAWSELRGLPLWSSVPLIAPLTALLVYVAVARPRDRAVTVMPEARELAFAEPVYRRILVPVDHTPLDRVALAHAVALGKPHGAVIHLLHVEEGVASQVYGDEARTAEVELGRRYFEELAHAVRLAGLPAELEILHGKEVKSLIIHAARRIRPDLIVMGAHGHRGLMDLVFGATINEVRHGVDVPVLVVRMPA